jgi:hypothetical protein
VKSVAEIRSKFFYFLSHQKVERKFASGFNNPLFFNKVDKLKVQVLCCSSATQIRRKKVARV